MLLEEHKYIAKGKKMPEYITDDIEMSSDSDGEDSDENNFKFSGKKSNEENSV